MLQPTAYGIADEIKKKKLEAVGVVEEEDEHGVRGRSGRRGIDYSSGCASAARV